MSEVEKLCNHFQDNHVTGFHVSLVDGCTATTEEIAAEINAIHDHMADPINSLIARIEGHMFLKSDTVKCMEQRHQVLEESPFFKPVPLTQKERWDVDRLKKDISLFSEAVDMIKSLRK